MKSRLTFLQSINRVDCWGDKTPPLSSFLIVTYFLYAGIALPPTSRLLFPIARYIVRPPSRKRLHLLALHVLVFVFVFVLPNMTLSLPSLSLLLAGAQFLSLSYPCALQKWLVAGLSVRCRSRRLSFSSSTGNMNIPHLSLEFGQL